MASRNLEWTVSRSARGNRQSAEANPRATSALGPARLVGNGDALGDEARQSWLLALVSCGHRDKAGAAVTEERGGMCHGRCQLS